MPTDLRSDTVTLLTAAIRATMVEAELGDDVFAGEPQVLTQQAAGSILPSDIEANNKPDGAQFAKTRLLALENTWAARCCCCLTSKPSSKPPPRWRGARAWPPIWTARDCSTRQWPVACRQRGSRAISAASRCAPAMAGARRWAQRWLGTRPSSRAHRFRETFSGGLRQAGVIGVIGVTAAAASYALDDRIARLVDNHADARAPAQGLAGRHSVTVQPPQTNIALANLAPEKAADFVDRLRAAGVLCMDLYRLRFVTHLSVSSAASARAVAVLRRPL